MKKFFVLLLLGCVYSIQWSAATSCQQPTASKQEVDFRRQVLPILSDKCFVCHGPDSEAESDLRLDSFEAATKDLGGYAAIDLKDLPNSELLVRVHSEDDPMPPEGAKSLTDKEREILDRWVKNGGKYQKHWAFVRPHKHQRFVESREAISAGQVIDTLIAEGLGKQGVSFSPSANKRIWARRTALVLTGLPPEPNWLQTFLADTSKSAKEKFVDRLLASPRYGEHQARYWLDAIRYGDTHGLHLDNRRGIYPYRDWVVKAFNDNLPFDRFVVWQLAGDLLQNPTMEQQVATGFVRMNPTTSEGGAIAAEFQAKNNFDRVEVLGTSLMGLSLICARCHHHKYDPISQTEYYQLFAFFNNTTESALDGNRYAYGPVVKAPANQQDWQRWSTLQSAKCELVQLLEGRKSELSPVQKTNWEAANAQQKYEWIRTNQGPIQSLNLGSVLSLLESQTQELESRYTTTLVAAERKQPRETRVLHRGEYDQPSGPVLLPGFLSALEQRAQKNRLQEPSKISNRLDLARWLTSAEHPLVTRVVVNQIWQRVFGHGLVRTPEEFGLQGQYPTHPELLDWLAVDFRESGWDQKRLIKEMVLSRTFSQSSAQRKDLDDPANRWFGRGPAYRLDAEVLRDLALWGSGILREEMGGEGVKPYQPGGMWKALAHPASNTKNYVPDSGDKLYRRSLYLYWKRTSPHPMMTLFDAPSRESSCVRRSRTNTSLQSLALLNETQRTELARVYAEKLLRQTKLSDENRLQQVFLQLACRVPSPSERQVCLKLLQTMKEEFARRPKDAEALLSIGNTPRNRKINSTDYAAWSQLMVVILASDSVITLY